MSVEEEAIAVFKKFNRVQITKRLCLSLLKVAVLNNKILDKIKRAYKEFWEIEEDLNERLRWIQYKYDPDTDLLQQMLAFSLNNIGWYYK